MIIGLRYIKCDSCGDAEEAHGITKSWIRAIATEQGWMQVSAPYGVIWDYCPCCVGIIKTPIEQLLDEGFEGRYYNETMPEVERETV